jgi:hypothetical protein
VRTATGSRRQKIADFYTRVHAECHGRNDFADGHAGVDSISAK